MVSGERSKIGAVHSRLEHVVSNLLTASDKLVSSESRIRDTDMAKDMMEFARIEIIMKASQAMMAQANQNSKGVLSLLKS